MARFQVIQDTWSAKEKDAVLRDFGKRVIADSFTWDPPSVPANSSLTTTILASAYPSLTGLRTGMFIAVTPPPGISDDLTITATYVGADNTLTIKLRNATAAPIDQGSGEWAFLGVLL